MPSPTNIKRDFEILFAIGFTVVSVFLALEFFDVLRPDRGVAGTDTLDIRSTGSSKHDRSRNTGRGLSSVTRTDTATTTADTSSGAPVEAPTLGWHEIESSHIDTGSVTSRTIEDGTIRGKDIDRDTNIEVEVITAQYGSFETISAGSWNASVIGVAYGGTNATTIGSAGSIAYSTGTAYAFSAVGSAGQVFVSGGSGSPTWSTLGAASISADSLDFTELEDQLDLDASTDILADGSEVLSITNTGTGNSFVVNDQAGDTTPFVIDASGNVGIGDTTPAALFTVGSGDLFQVNSSGAIASATGITSSGTITFSGLSTAGIVTNTAGGVLGTTSTIGVTLGGTGTSTQFTQGSVVFAGASGVYSQDNANFFWDDTNNRLGIAYATPAARLDITGNTTTATEGSEQITATADRDFSSDTGNWTGTNWTVGGWLATHTAGANAITLAAAGLDPDPVAGGVYQISFGVSTTTVGTIAPSIGGGNGVALGQFTGYSTHTQIIAATDTSPLTFTPNATWVGSISNVSVKRIIPSNATQIVRNSDNTIGLEIRAGGTGLSNTLVGVNAGRAITTGSSNVFLGGNAGLSVTTGSSNTFIGYQSGYTNTTGLSNSFIGYQSGYANISGSYNSFIGYQSGYANISGSYNNFIGYQSGYTNTTGSSNSFLGHRAGYSNTSGSFNTFLGNASGFWNTTGSRNIYLGNGAGGDSTTGEFNTFVGTSAGQNNTTSSYNTALGYQAGSTSAPGGNYNVTLGYGTRTGSTVASSIVLGYNALSLASNQLVIGSNNANGSIADAYFGQGVTSVSPAGIVLNATGGIGTNNAGGPLTLAGGKGTGSASGGSIIFATSDAGASGSTLQSLTTKATLLASGNFGIGDTTPASLLTVGSGDLFQVNSSGAIASATGITSSGSITFSGLSAGGVVQAASGTGLLSVGTLGASGITADSLDFTEFQDQLDLDASTDILADGAEVFSITNTGTGNSFVVNDAAGDTTPFVINASGNVGIGMASPSYKLHISGGSSYINVSSDDGQTSSMISEHLATNSAGSMARALTINVAANNSSDKSATSLYGILGNQLQHAGTGILGHLIGIKLNGPTNTGSGTVNGAWNLYLADTGSRAATQQSAIHIEGSGDWTGITFSGVPGPGGSAGSSRIYSPTAGNIALVGNFGIGDTTPASLFTVGGGDLFQVNSSGAIAAATGVTSSGTITFSGLSTAGIVTNTAGGVLGTVSSVPIANGGTNATTVGSAGSIAYSTGSAYAFSSVGTAGQALISGGTGAPTFYAPTAGSILFAGTSGVLSQDNANFFWDDTNNRLGIGDSTPDAVFDLNLVSTSTTAGTEYGSTITVSDSGVVTTGTDTTYGTYTSLNRTGATGGTINTYGQYANVTGSTGGTSTAIGQYGQATAADSSYGVYGIANTTNANTTASGVYGFASTGFLNTTVYGVYASAVAFPSGTSYALYANGTVIAESNYAAAFMYGNVGIGDDTPSALLTVGSGDLFRVNSSGAIAAATGVTSSGTITFSGLSTAGIVTNTAGGVLGTVSSVPIANGGTNATTVGSAGSIAYSTGSAYAFSSVGTAGQALISGGTGAPTFYAPTAGSILFAGTSGVLSQDNANFFWDDTNNRLGLGDATPDTALDILSSGAAHSYLTIANTNAGNYNPAIRFELTENSPLFSLGLDDSDSDKFKIYAGADISGTNQFTMDSTGAVSIANLNLGSMNFDADAGMVSWVDMPVTSAAVAGTVESYSAQLDGNPILTVYAESDGTGSIRNSGVSVGNASLQTGAKFAVTQSSTSTTADTIYGFNIAVSDTGIVTTGTDIAYGGYLSVTRTGATGGTITNYGQYISLTGDAGGTSTNTGLYVAVTGADTNYAGIFTGGNVGIGSVAPTSLLTLGGNGAVGGSFLSQSSSGSEWFSISSGIIRFNSAGGTTLAGGIDLGARFNIAPINDTYPTLAVRGYAGGTSDIIRVSSSTSTTGDYLIVKSDGKIGLGTVTPATRLDVSGLTLNTDANGTVGAANFTYSLTKNDTNTRAFSGLSIVPTLNAGASNANTTLNILKIDTTNTAITGVTTNLIKASYGGVSRFVVDSAGNVTSTIGQISGADGLVTKVNAGACDDAAFTLDTDGTICIDSVNGRIYYRYGGAWHYSAQTAGFQIPDYEAYGYDFATDSFDEDRPLVAGDFLMPFVETSMEDGALHGLYARWSDVKGELFAEEKAQIDDLSLKTDQSVTTVGALQASVDTQLEVIGDALTVLGAESGTTKDSITALDSRVLATETATTAIRAQIAGHDTTLASLETQMATLSAQNQVIMDFFTVLDLDRVVVRDQDGNVDLLEGKIRARLLETGGIVVENVDENAPTIGTATIPQGQTTVGIATGAVKSDSKIFVTPVSDTALLSPLTILSKTAGETFEVGIPEALDADLSFDWWIVEPR